MVIGRSTPGKVFHANKIFTDREDERKLFRRHLTARQDLDSYQVLHWYGVGGQGKSELSRELMRIFNSVRDLENTHTISRPFAGARIEFEAPVLRQPDQALLALRLQLGKSGKISFPSFDLAFARFISLNNPGVRIRELHPELFRGDSELLEDVTEIIEGGLDTVVTDIAGALVPGLNVVVKYTQRLSQRSREWFERRGRTELVGLDMLTADEIFSRLPIYFGHDMCHALRDRAGLRAVIILDGYEALWKDSPQASHTTLGHRMDEWVRLLVQNCPGVLFAIFGRDRLAWPAVDPGWEPIIDAQLLGGLSEQDADAFLKTVPVEEPDIRQRIIESARGLPFYLDLQVDLYAHLKNLGQAPTLDQFGGGHPDILARFLDHIGETEELVLRLASYPSALTEADMTRLAEKFLGGAALFDWSKLVARSFISNTSDETFTMHRLMREQLQEREKKDRPTVYRNIHTFLFEQMSAQIPKEAGRITSVHDQLFWDCEAHLTASGGGGNWVAETIKIFNAAARSRLLRDYWARDYQRFDQSLGPEHPSTLTTRANLALELGALGEHRAARDEFQAIYDIWTRPDMLGPEHPSTLTTRVNLAHQLGALGEHRAALNELQAIYDIETRPDMLGPEHPSTLTTRANLAQQLGDLCEHRAARDEFQAIYDIQTRPDMLGPEHPSTLTTRANLALELGALGEHRAARDELQAIYDIQTRPDMLGPEHPSTLATRHNLAWEIGALGKHRAALNEFQAIYDIQTRPDMLGPEHPSTLTTRAHLARMKARVGDFEEALSELNHVHCALAKAFDEEHPRVLRVRGFIAEALILSGDVEKGCAMARQVLVLLVARFEKTHFQIGEMRRLIAEHCGEQDE